ncbi:MAG TPA: amino acid permease [Bryobacteraceae bacterium]|nr:amino acid permease [Bryobacteraceae bacterium]
MAGSVSTRPTYGLLRQLGIVSATALVVSNMVGAGIFTTTGFLAGQLGSTSLVLSIWIVGAVCALAGAICYSELGINFPSSGGEFVYLTEAYGPTWGFMTGWVSFFAGFSAPIAVAAVGFSDYLGDFFPVLRDRSADLVIGSGPAALRIGGAQMLACAIIALFTVLNCLGVRRVAGVQNVLTGIKVAVLVLFVIVGFAAGAGDPANFSRAAVRTTATPLSAQFAISLFFIYVAYSGWNAATYVAEELKRPTVTLPMALALGTVLVAAIYVGLNAVFIYAVPLEQMKGVVAVGALAASHLFGPQTAGLFSAGMCVSLLATVNAMVTVGPRVYYAMARNGAFFSAAARVDPRWHTPVIAIVCQGICAMLITFSSFRDVLYYIGFTLNFFAGMSVASLLIFRRRPGWRKLQVVSFAWPVIPVFFVLVGIWITIFGLIHEPKVSFWAVLTIATGALAYHWRLMRERSTHA